MLVAGTYAVGYTATDAAGNTGTSTRVVTVNPSGNGPINSGGGGGGGGGGGSPFLFQGINTFTGQGTQGQVLGAQSKFRFTLNLRIGSRGTEVTELQKVLIAGGFLKIAAPTGYFGPATQVALKAYQKKYGIPQTGTVGPLTRAQLNK
jgi:hypothetical protein